VLTLACAAGVSAQAVTLPDAQVLRPSEAAPASAVCSDDFERGVNVGVWRFGVSSGSAATTSRQLCDALANAGTPNPNPEGLAVTECDVSLADGDVFVHVSVDDDAARFVASEVCLRLNDEAFPTHLYWFS
jgi:hypothetical protein